MIGQKRAKQPTNQVQGQLKAIPKNFSFCLFVDIFRSSLVASFYNSGRYKCPFEDTDIMSIIGEFEIDECSDNSCSNNSSLHIDNSQSFPLGFADFEQYCSPTDLTSEYERNAPLTEHVAVDTTRSSTLLGPHEM